MISRSIIQQCVPVLDTDCHSKIANIIQKVTFHCFNILLVCVPETLSVCVSIGIFQ